MTSTRPEPRHADIQHLDGAPDERISLSPGSARDQPQQSHSIDESAALEQNAAAASYADDGAAELRGDEPAGMQDGGDKDDVSRPWSELKTKAGKERKRLPLACIVCRRKKIRCSGEKPACKHCFRSRIPCVYKVTTRKAAPRTDYMAMLDKRLKRMEERVIKIIPKDVARDMATIGRAAVKPPTAGQMARVPKAMNKKRSADEAFRAELNGWIREGNPSGLRDGPAGSWQPRVVDENKLLIEGAEFLPSMDIQEHLAEVFFDCVYGQSYLLLHKPSFIRRLKAKAVPPVLTLAICAVAARFSTHPLISTEPAFLRGENWADAAATIALSRHDQPNITILTVFLILGLHEFGACHGGRSWSFGGQALRMAYALQLHQELDHDPLGNNAGHSQLSFTDREIRRRTMWACVLMDRYNSSGSQRPPIGNEKYLQIQLPIKESHFQMEIPGPTENLDGSVPNPVPEGIGQLFNPKENMGVSAYIIRGVMLWGRIVDYLNLGGKLKDPHPLWSPESGYAGLKRQIEEFSASLPNSLGFTLENLRNHGAEKIGNQFLFLHIIIHQNILFLNRFAIPLSPGGRPPKDIPKPFLSDAGRAAVEAAGHISTLISQASGYMLTVPFAGYCAYAASTVHIWGIFSKNEQLEKTSKENLRHTYRYLNRMKQYWGMFHYMVESAKDRYRQFADAAIKGPTIKFFASLSPQSQVDQPRKEMKRRGTSAAEKSRRTTAGKDSRARFETTGTPAQAQLSPQRDAQPPALDTNPQPPLPHDASQFPSSVVFTPTEPPDFNHSTFKYPLSSDLPHLDRQLVYGAYSGIAPNHTTGPFSSMTTASGHHNSTLRSTSTVAGLDQTEDNGNSFWNMPLDIPGDGTGWPTASVQPSAWFLPFNLEPIGAGEFDISEATAAVSGPQQNSRPGGMSVNNPSYFRDPGVFHGYGLNLGTGDPRDPGGGPAGSGGGPR
ncbi:conserved hypothetical protein [Uncinocarpus reesii 1704]|uniref:Zn(2)-C6 fungal-type domain-containing protein n=1 Tax=Uncinocarpus reesii (strain UAMH 1704) TaxID=336963 RepID=C4JKB9_UNCRE|nr:uncharacterized protein UREG_02076 [Uncinocarpus reesii 1704]EEP77227.1 conserved hypothetical protein [Uncinocarpus reesii 1704]